MMNTWKKYDLDTILKDVYKNDKAVLMGISAGAICWFNCGCTDSNMALINEGRKFGWTNEMLNIHNIAYCPHYEDRIDDFEILMKEKRINGLALESNTAFVEDNGKIYYIKSIEEAKAYKLINQNDKILKEEIKTIFLK